MQKKLFRVAYAMNYLTNAILSLLIPAGLLIGGGWLLYNRCGLGKWVMITAIVLGVLAGIYSFFRFLLKTANRADPTTGKGEQADDG